MQQQWWLPLEPVYIYRTGNWKFDIDIKIAVVLALNMLFTHWKYACIKKAPYYIITILILAPPVHMFS